MYEMFGAAEFMYHQAKQKALPREVWTRWKQTVAWWFHSPGVRAWWENKPAPMSSDFEQFCDDLLRTETADQQAARRWELFVTGPESMGTVGRGGESQSGGAPADDGKCPR